MFVIEGRETRAEIRDQREIDRIAVELARKEYGRVLGAVVDALCNAASVEAEISTDRILYGRPYLRRRQEGVPVGEMFFRRQHGFVVRPMRKKLQVWSFRYHTSQSMVEQFCRDFEEAARATLDGRRLRGMDFTWKDIPIQSIGRPRYWEEEEAEEIELGTQPNYTSEDVELTRLLLNKNVRSFVLRLAQVRKARAIDASADIDVQNLIDKGLIRQEYLVSCREDSHTISALPSQDLLEQVGQEFRCPVCGRTFGEEIVQEIYVLTDRARSLISGSRWMSIWVTELLLGNGVERDSLHWGLEINGEELDIVLSMWGFRVFFELKDREFGLGDAYPFVYRVSRYGGNWGIVVTTDKVAKDAKKFLEEQGGRTAMLPGPQPVGFKTIEGENKIPQGISDLVNELTKSAVLRLVSHFGEFGLSVEPVVAAWIDARISQNA